MEEYYYYFIFVTFILSGAILLLSIVRFRTIGLIDVAVVFSWFYIFFRPSAIDFCHEYIAKDVYFWNYEYYIFGVFYSIFSLILFQFGALLYSSKKSEMFILMKSRHEYFLCSLKDVLSFFIFLYVLLLLVIFLNYGTDILPWNRPVGAFSTSLPGFQFFWPLIRLILFFSIPVSLFLYFETQKTAYLISFAFIVSTALFLGRRGILVGPVLFFLFIYSFYIFRYKNLSVNKLFKFSYFFILLILIFIIFFGKEAVSIIFDRNYASLTISAGEDFSKLCMVVKKGQQEFDVFWPAVVDGYSPSNIFDLIPAMLGGFIPHELRLLEYPSLYSITDKLMMEYIGDVYLYKKFGISPNKHQFYYSYFGYFSLVLIFFIGYLSRKLEYFILEDFFKSKYLQMYFWFLFFGLINGPFDYTFKYYAVGFVYFSFFYIIYRIFFIKNSK